MHRRQRGNCTGAADHVAADDKVRVDLFEALAAPLETERQSHRARWQLVDIVGNFEVTTDVARPVVVGLSADLRRAHLLEHGGRVVPERIDYAGSQQGPEGRLVEPPALVTVDLLVRR